MADRTDSGVVLQVRDLGDSDLLVDLLTLRHGRIRSLAKHARRSKQRFVNTLEPFSILEVRLRWPRRPDAMVILADAELRQANLNLRFAPDRFLAAELARELLIAFSGPQEQEPAMFHVAGWVFDALHRGVSGSLALLVLLVRLLAISGYGLAFDRCGRCRSTGVDGGLALLPEHGVLLCSACRRASGRRGIDLSPRALKAMAAMGSWPLDRLERLVELTNRGIR